MLVDGSLSPSTPSSAASPRLSSSESSMDLLQDIAIHESQGSPGLHTVHANLLSIGRTTRLARSSASTQASRLIPICSGVRGHCRMPNPQELIRDVVVEPHQLVTMRELTTPKLSHYALGQRVMRIRFHGANHNVESTTIPPHGLEMSYTRHHSHCAIHTDVTITEQYIAKGLNGAAFSPAVAGAPTAQCLSPRL